MDKNSKIYVAGHTGLVGSAIMRCLECNKYHNIVVRDLEDLDLRNQEAVNTFFREEKPQYVFLAAAKVGGILANNTYPAEFIYDNLLIEANIIHAAYQNNVTKLLFLGSSCIYPKMATQPIKEEYLLSGYLEETNEAYAIAKITGIELCKFYRRQYGCDFISAMPTNLYGINDNFDLTSSHVLPALIRKFHDAKIQGKDEVVIWGTGNPMREFLYVDDLADALLFLMLHYSKEMHINIGTGEDIRIGDLALMVKEIVGFTGNIVNDTSKPDGTPRKLLDVSKLHALGFKHKTSLEQGIITVYNWYLNKQ
jgi:GDP-L-fucose synthase